MKSTIFFLSIILFSCTDTVKITPTKDETTDNETSLSTVFTNDVISVFSCDSLIQVQSKNNYFLDIPIESESNVSFKGFIEIDSEVSSLQEWIHFDSLLNPQSINLSIINFSNSEDDSIVSISGKLMSTLPIDESIVLIYSEDDLLYLEPLENNVFNCNISSSKNQELNIEILNLRINKQDSSIVSRSIIKSYISTELNYREVVLSNMAKRDIYQNEKRKKVRGLLEKHFK